MKPFNSPLIALLSLLGFAFTPVAADESQTIIYYLTSDDAWSAEMALDGAGRDLASGHDVVIRLNHSATSIASNTLMSEVASATGMTLQQKLEGTLKQGARVIICPVCMRESHMTESDLIAGIIIGEPDVTSEAMTAENTTQTADHAWD